MKASIKFREDQKPLLRAKIPLNVLRFPFQSGIVACEPKEMSLNLSTFFDAGPAFKVAYRPNDSRNSFSFICKIGIGNFGSPISSPFTMSAEFNFVGNQNPPSFFLHFKPKFGDFSIKRSHCSASPVKKAESNARDCGIGKTEEALLVKHGHTEVAGLVPAAGKIAVSPAESAAVATGVVEDVISGAEIKAKTAFPLTGRAIVNVRWSLRFPPNTAADTDDDAVMVGKSERRAGISFQKFPMLLMDKISVEHVARKDPKGAETGSSAAGSDDEAGVWLDVKKQLETIQAENGLLRKALNDLRSETDSPSSGNGRVDRKQAVTADGKAVNADVSEGFKKAS